MTDEVKGFKRWHAAGFTTELIPVIPVNAELIPNSTVQPHMRGKTPGERNPGSGRWHGLTGKWSDTLTATLDDLKAWHRWGAAVGVQGRKFPGLDVDVDDAELVAAIVALAIAILGPAPIRSRPGSARRLLMYSGEGLRKVRLQFARAGGAPMGGTSAACELLAKGQYYNLEGDHPKGGAYEWDAYPSWTDLSQINAEKVLAFFTALRELVEARGWTITTGSGSATSATGARKPLDDASLWAPRPQLVLDALKAYPCDADHFENRDDLVRFLPAVKAALGPAREEHRGAVLQWFLNYEGAEAAYFDKIWDSITDAALGWGWLEGKVGAGIGAQEAFADTPTTDTPALPETPFDRMVAGFVWVHELGAFVDLKTRRAVSAQAFKARNTGVAPFGSSGIKAADAIFINSSEGKKVTTATYRPGAEVLVKEGQLSAVNLWTPSPLTPIKGADVTPWLALVDELLAPEEREHLLDWLAFVMQHPGVKPNHAPLVIGAHGIGKDSMFAPLFQWVGKDNWTLVQPKDLEGSFNAYLEKQLVLVGEMMNFSKREITNKLKPYLAAPPDRVEVNKKHLHPYSIPNISVWVFMSNFDDAISLEEGDRRFWIARCQVEGQRDRRSLWHWYTHEQGFEKVAGFLLARNLTRFDAFAPPPMTDAKRAMLDHSMPASLRWFVSELTEGQWNGRELMVVNEMMAAARNGFEAGPKVAESARDTHASTALRRSGFATLDGKFKVNGSAVKLWARAGRDKLNKLEARFVLQALQSDRERVAKTQTA